MLMSFCFAKNVDFSLRKWDSYSKSTVNMQITEFEMLNDKTDQNRSKNFNS